MFFTIYIDIYENSWTKNVIKPSGPEHLKIIN